MVSTVAAGGRNVLANKVTMARISETAVRITGSQGRTSKPTASASGKANWPVTIRERAAPRVPHFTEISCCFFYHLESHPIAKLSDLDSGRPKADKSRMKIGNLKIPRECLVYQRRPHLAGPGRDSFANCNRARPHITEEIATPANQQISAVGNMPGKRSTSCLVK